MSKNLPIPPLPYHVLSSNNLVIAAQLMGFVKFIGDAPPRSRSIVECVRAMLPYTLQKVDDHRFRVLNREYKPLGIFDNVLVDYSDFPCIVKFENSKVIEEIFYYEEFLYTGNNPCGDSLQWRLYLNRVKKFITLL